MMLRYFFFQTPQFVYYVIPMAALVATLVTIGLMTKNSELVVMRACGISLYRTAAPLLLFARRGERGAVRPAGAGDGVLEPRGRSAESRSSAGCRRRASGRWTGAGWSAQNGDIYHYDVFDADEERVPPVRRLSPRPGALGPAVDDAREPRRADAAGAGAVDEPERGVGGARPAGRASSPRRPSETSRRPWSSTSRLPSGRCRSSLPATSRATSPTRR